MAERATRFSYPAEVTGYFRNKTVKPAFSYLDVWAEEHAYSMTVAKTTELEVTSAFHRTIAEAIDEGKGFDNWKPLIQKELTKLGWWQPRMVSDPSGVDIDRMVNFSSDRRLKTIFWGNMSSARSAGQWERAQRSKRVLPYVLYMRTTSGDPRAEHLQWVGIILPIDHPFWKTHWPPNGWLCKCQVRMISEREARELLGTTRIIGKNDQGEDIVIRYTDSPPDLGPDIQHRNRRTGEISMVPPGIDAGWHTNPGLARATTLIRNFETQLAAAPAADATRVLKELWDDPYLRLAPRLPQKVWLPAGVSKELAADLGAKSAVISVTSETIVERIGRHKMSVDDFTVYPELLADGLVLPDPRGKGNVRSIIRRIGKAWWRAFVTLSETGYMRATSLHQKQEKELRNAVERAGMAWPEGE